jgi:SSS family solute:Na+ symporter
MALTATDWIVIGAYLSLNLLISLYYRRRSSGSTEEFFVSGRNLLAFQAPRNVLTSLLN